MDNKDNVIEKKIEEKKSLTIVDKYKYDILNIFGIKILINGYNLILYYYNYDINEVYDIFIRDGIKVYSIKIDAFTIDKCNLDKIREVLKFGNEIGKWK